MPHIKQSQSLLRTYLTMTESLYARSIPLNRGFCGYCSKQTSDAIPVIKGRDPVSAQWVVMQWVCSMPCAVAYHVYESRDHVALMRQTQWAREQGLLKGTDSVQCALPVQLLKVYNGPMDRAEWEAGHRPLGKTVEFRDYVHAPRAVLECQPEAPVVKPADVRVPKRRKRNLSDICS